MNPTHGLSESNATRSSSSSTSCQGHKKIGAAKKIRKMRPQRQIIDVDRLL